MVNGYNYDQAINHNYNRRIRHNYDHNYVEFSGYNFFVIIMTIITRYSLSNLVIPSP